MIIKKLVFKLGIDKAIIYTLFAKLIQGLGSLLVIFGIAKFLNITEQGYYYTFGSILALQMFFELGLSSIITQFAAHEIVHLKWKDKYTLEGDIIKKSRLSSLLHFCVKWFSSLALFLFLFLLFVGYVFFEYFGKLGEGVSWKGPWLILTFATGCNLIVTPLLSFFEGIGKVKNVAKLRMYQQFIQLFLLVTSLLGGLKLYSGGIAAFGSFLIVSIWILSKGQMRVIRCLWKEKSVNYIISWKQEIFPFQWRIAVSWLSGFFMFYLFTPIIFATDGPIVAGQMGMTLAALTGITSLIMSWINTKIPTMSGFISKKDFLSLDQLFFKTLYQALSVSIFIFLLFIIGVNYMDVYEYTIAERFLDIKEITLLCIITFINQIVFYLATYLRCHKKEPFMINSITMAILISFSTFVLGQKFGMSGIILGYFVLTVFVYFPWNIYVFKQKRKLWHY